MKQSDDYIMLGEISGVLGVKGWVKVFSHTSPRVKITEYSHWFLQGKDKAWKSIKLLDGRKQGKNIVVKLEGINDRNQAEALKGVTVAIDSEQLETLSKNEYYWKDLIGLLVETTTGKELGEIDWLFDTGSNDVIIVKGNIDGENVEYLIPYLMGDYVKSIDLEASRMVVDWDPEF
ncbi:MAG: ribosome maturation factor RimM [Cocleimonas sp.]